MSIDWGQVFTGAIGGALAGGFTGFLGGLLALWFRRTDRKAKRAETLAALVAPMQDILARNLANHRLTHRTGRSNVGVIFDRLSALMAETDTIASRLKPDQAAALRAKVEEYASPEDYRKSLALAIDRAESLLQWLSALR